MSQDDSLPWVVITWAHLPDGKRLAAQFEWYEKRSDAVAAAPSSGEPFTIFDTRVIATRPHRDVITDAAGMD